MFNLLATFTETKYNKLRKKCSPLRYCIKCGSTYHTYGLTICKQCLKEIMEKRNENQ